MKKSVLLSLLFTGFWLLLSNLSFGCNESCCQSVGEHSDEIVFAVVDSCCCVDTFQALAVDHACGSKKCCTCCSGIDSLNFINAKSICTDSKCKILKSADCRFNSEQRHQNAVILCNSFAHYSWIFFNRDLCVRINFLLI